MELASQLRRDTSQSMPGLVRYRVPASIENSRLESLELELAAAQDHS